LSNRIYETTFFTSQPSIHYPFLENYTQTISFDWAQALSYPSSPQQVGKLYFLSPAKVQILGARYLEGLINEVLLLNSS